MLFCFFIFSAILHSLAWSAPQEINESFYGKNIYKVNFSGLRKVEAQAILEKIGSIPGSVLERQILENDLKNIYKMKYFEKVAVFGEDHPKGMILKFVVQEKPIIKGIRIEGNEEEDEDELRKQIKSKPYGIIDISTLNSDIRSLQKFYEDKGYFLINVSYEVKEVNKENVDIVFKISENQQVKVKKIIFLGNKMLHDEELKNIMMTREDALLASMSGAGSFRDFYFQADLERLNYYYRTKGYLQVNIANPVVTVTDDKKWIFVTMQINEGPQFTVDQIDFSGDLLFTDSELMSKLQLLPEQIYNEETLRLDIQTLTEAYQDLGYAFANVVRTLEPVEGQNKVKIHYSFEKGQKAYLGKITVRGNTKTRDKVVRRELEIYEGMLYSGSKMRISKENVNRLGFFDKDSVIFNSITPPGKSNIVDVDIVVKERQTGQISLGAGYSSSTKGFIQASVSQSNFRGLGEDLNFSLNLASQQQTYSVGFTEPYFLDSKWSLGGMVYKSNSNTIESFDYAKEGFDVRVGRPVFPYTRGYLTYGYRDTEVTDTHIYGINTDEESGVASGLEISLVQDKRNNSFEPSNGHWASVALEYVGLGGDFKWLRHEIEGRYYKTVWGDLVFRSRARITQLFETSDKKVPRTERFSMGGSNNLRGFGSNDIGPLEEKISKDSKVPGIYNVGGLFSALATFEMEHPLIEEAGLKWVVFYDTGNVYRKYMGQGGDYSLRSDYGLGMRWFSPIGVLRFELGFPINKKKEEASNQFDFGIGQNF